MHSSAASFPVDAAIPELGQALAAHGRAVLTASPGSGKTTRVPLALLGLLPGLGQQHSVSPLSGTILVLEPRRLAARAAARYMAGLLGEEVGQRVGYRVRLESRVSRATRVELLTEGMFTRRLLADPELSGVSCVIFDEFHERSLQADLGLALCLESAEAFRPDLRLLLMSATLDAGELSRFLGDCPVIEAGGRIWPVDVRHAEPALTVSPASRLEEVAGKTALAVRTALRDEHGSILVFLPGQAEIRRTAELLEQRPDMTDIHPLYGDLPAREQDAAIAPPPPGRRKVVLATDLAQTSLTIEGVRVVIDAGLARSPRFEPATGLSRLVTSRLTQDAADQRAGRAGRLEPGLCLRLWPGTEALLPQARPEIVDADLAPLYLDALSWGSEPSELPWLTPPPQAALRHAAETLLGLEAVEPGPAASGGRLAITPHGQKLARLPLHPRLAHMVLRAADLECSSLAACLAALVSERDPLRKRAANGSAASQSSANESSADVRLRLPLLRRPENRRIRDAAGQIHRLSGLKNDFQLPGPEDEDFCGTLLSLAWPERIAQRRSEGSFRLASGQGAELSAHDPLATEPWLAVASLGGGVNRRIHLAAPIALADLLRLHGGKARREEEIAWDSRSEAVVCRSVSRLGALILEEKPLPPSPELAGRVKGALLQGIVSMGLDCLPWTDELRQFQARVLLLRTLEGEGAEESRWPDMSDAALLAGLVAGVSGGANAGATGANSVGANGANDAVADGAGTEVADGTNIGLTGGAHAGSPDGTHAGSLDGTHAGVTGGAGTGAAHRPNAGRTGTATAGVADGTKAGASGDVPTGPEHTWLSPWLDGISRRSQLSTLDLGAALRALLPWPLPGRLDEQAPLRLDLPSGSTARLDYLPVLRGEPPVLAVKLQEMFGQTDTPRLASGRVPVMLHLLSPAGRPLQVTGDLRHFWLNAYKQVRAEMRGRYPKHPWPEDPMHAEPTGKTKKRFEATREK